MGFSNASGIHGFRFRNDGRVDEAIARTKVAVEQASRAIEGMLQRLFVEGIGHSAFKDGHSTPIPASWDEKSLGALSATPVTYGVVQPGPLRPGASATLPSGC